MLYTVFFVILWLIMGAPALMIGTTIFWALIVAVLVDIFWTGYWNRGYIRKI